MQALLDTTFRQLYVTVKLTNDQVCKLRQIMWA